MKFKFYIILLVIISLASCTNKHYSNYFTESIKLDYFKLKGNVRNIKTKVYEIEGNLKKPIKGESFLFGNNSEIKFSNNGILIGTNDYDKNGNFIDKTTYSYDYKGRIKSLETSKELIEYSYTNFDSLKKVKIQIKDFLRVNKIIYNDSNRKIERLDYVNDSLVCHYFYEYDNKGNEIYCNKEFSDYRPMIITRKYNENNLLTIENLKFKDSSKTGIGTIEIRYKYNEYNKLIEIDNGYDIEKTFYNSSDNIKKEIINNESGYNFTREYNDNSDLIKEYEIGDSGDTISLNTNIYEYDKMNNWIIKTKTTACCGVKRKFITEREIKYYD